MSLILPSPYVINTKADTVPPCGTCYSKKEVIQSEHHKMTGNLIINVVCAECYTIKHTTEKYRGN